MPLTEKELLRFLWEEPATCQTRGLTIYHDFFACGQRYQQLNLGPYGVAQLVNVRYSAASHCFYVQVFGVSAGAITPKVYQQAQRHLSALRQLLQRQVHAAGISAQVQTNCVLIGQQVQLAGDFVFALNLDTSCQAFTYEYGPRGILFENVGRDWHLTGSEQHPALQQLGQALLAERTTQLALEQAARTEWLASITAEPGELAEELVVTAEGVVKNNGLSREGAPHE